MTHPRMQLERMVRLVAVKKNRDRYDGDVGQNDGRNDAAPPREVKYAGKQ